MNKREQNKNENEEKKNDETESEQQPAAPSSLRLADLPILTKAWFDRAARPERIEFFMNFMTAERIGTLEWFNMGFMLQNSGPNRIRCIHVYDDPISFHGLASIARTISLAGGVLELDPFTVIAPWNYDTKENSTQVNDAPNKASFVTGMEVA